MEDHEIVIVAAKRTPTGSFLGGLSTLTAPQLGAVAHKAALEQAGINPDELDEVISGCVLSAGIGQAPARQAAILAGIPESIGATTVNKVCGSGMKSLMFAHDLIKAGSANIILASGMESMSNAPYLLSKARGGFRIGHGELKDHLFLDGLEDAYEKGKLMGLFAETTAQVYQFSRQAQDTYAKASMTKALKAIQEGTFIEEIAPVSISTKQGEVIMSQDEGPDSAKITKIPHLKPAFKEDGTVTAANSSSISDGAASIILMSAGEAKQRGLKPLAKIVAHASHAAAPEWFTTAPIEAIRKVLMKASWQLNEVDLYEINEAFAVVAMAAITDLNLNPEQVNIHGGACALGHPIGASGVRILVTLLYALKKLGKKRGIASLCIGGGEATAVAIEMF
ncbi:MAG: acetyl-CoA C-acyltransferase [Legionella sp.]|nr:acetyl-CoA C-acyltransferase [Legionella sp.]